MFMPSQERKWTYKYYPMPKYSIKKTEGLEKTGILNTL